MEVLNYFRTAQVVYEQALYDAQEGVWRPDLAFVNNVHGQLFRGTSWDSERGKPADGIERRIQGAKVRPPLEASDYLRAFTRLAPRLLEEREVLEGLAKAHVLFEAIHPYRDGNGPGWGDCSSTIWPFARASPPGHQGPGTGGAKPLLPGPGGGGL